MTFHVFEAVTESSFRLYVDTDQSAVDAKFVEAAEADTYALGTVEAENVEEALEKIRRGDWEYTQKC